ncbi:UNVERIFIED_CONTAM: hypothetical protein HHA_309095 [Hammondia hammondi]|eukprot:XP_008888124.1 hypothetical protein HHA_309095 [Hammondia hammondi]
MHGFCLSPQKNKTSVTSLLERLSDAHAGARGDPPRKKGLHLKSCTQKSANNYFSYVYKDSCLCFILRKNSIDTPSAISPRRLPTQHSTRGQSRPKLLFNPLPPPPRPCHVRFRLDK